MTMSAAAVAAMRKSMGLPDDSASNNIWAARPWATAKHVKDALMAKKARFQPIHSPAPTFKPKPTTGGTLGPIKQKPYQPPNAPSVVTPLPRIQPVGGTQGQIKHPGKPGSPTGFFKPARPPLHAPAGSHPGSAPKPMNVGGTLGAIKPQGVTVQQAAAARAELGLPPDPESDKIWASRPWATIQHVTDALGTKVKVQQQIIGTQGTPNVTTQKLNEIFAAVQGIGKDKGKPAQLPADYAGNLADLKAAIHGIPAAPDNSQALADINALIASLTGNMQGLIGEETDALNQTILGMQEQMDAQAAANQSALQQALDGQAARFAPLVSGDIASFGELRRSLDSRFGQALAQAEADRGRTEGQFSLAVDRLREQFSGLRDETMRGFSDRGLARQPRFAGRAMRELRDSETRTQGDLEIGRADRMGALDQIVNNLNINRDEELSLIDAEMARRRTALDSLLNGVGG